MSHTHFPTRAIQNLGWLLVWFLAAIPKASSEDQQRESAAPPAEAQTGVEKGTRTDAEVVETAAVAEEPEAPMDPAKAADLGDLGGKRRTTDTENELVVGPRDSVRVEKGETVESLTVFLGRATVNGHVLGDLVVLGGKATVNGTVDGSVVCTGCRLILGSNAVVQGNVAGFGKLERHRGAVVHGKSTLKKGAYLRDTLHQAPQDWLTNMSPEARVFFTENVFKARPLSLHSLWPWFALVGIAALHLLTVLLFPQSVLRTSQLISERPLTTLLLGVVAVPLALIVGLLLSAVTGCLAAPFVLLTVILAIILGKVALELQLGGRLLAAFDQSAARGSAGAGSIGWDSRPNLLAYALGSALLVIGFVVPYLGFGIWALVTIWGLGAVLLALFVRKNGDFPQPAAAGAGMSFANSPTTPPMPGNFSATVPATPPVIPSMTPPVVPPMTAPDAAPQASLGEALLVAAPLPAAVNAGIEPPVPTPSIPATDSIPLPPPPVANAAGSIPVNAPIPPNGPQGPTPLRAGATSIERELWSLPRAGVGIRLLACLIDLLVWALFSAIQPRWMERPLFEVAIIVGYFAGFWVWKGATIGGLLMGLRVIRLDGRRIDWQIGVVRSLASFLSLFSAGIGYFWCAWDRDQQTWQDKLAGTVVVKEEQIRSLI